MPRPPFGFVLHSELELALGTCTCGQMSDSCPSLGATPGTPTAANGGSPSPLSTGRSTRFASPVSRCLERVGLHKGRILPRGLYALQTCKSMQVMARAKKRCTFTAVDL
mmetsp:Transcript_8667/g.21870  ORF Transcript_8667/g.21870 Transcript_8667/m.21870 type:complete len:109 (-) Transcript_8667:443-769(-)